MQLHIGGDRSIPLDRLLFILNERGMTVRTRAYVEQAKQTRRYMKCETGKPKSYAVSLEHGREVVYATNIASATLEKRWRQAITHEDVTAEAAWAANGIERK